MAVGTSDGMVYDDELMYHLGEPSARITVTKQEPVLDPTYPSVDKFDDGPTMSQRTRDAGDPERASAEKFKFLEQDFDVNLEINGASEDTKKWLPDTQNIADQVLDPFGTKIPGKDQSRITPNAPFPNPPPAPYRTEGKSYKGGPSMLPSNPAAPEQVVATKTGQLTPLPDEDKKRFNEDTGIVSSKDPMWQDTGSQVRQEIEDMLNVPQEEHDARYNELKQYEKQNPNFKALGDALPAGRIKMRKDLPATQDFLEHLPDDVTAHEVNPNYILFIKKTPPPALTSSLQIDRTDGETNFLMNDEVKVAQSGSIADMGRAAYHRFLDALTANRDTTEGNREPPRGSLEREAGNTYNREIRRSPADGTFRPAEQLHTDWEGFNSVRVRPAPEPPRGWSEVEGGTPPDSWRGRLNSGREHGTVSFETHTGKEGSLDYIYDPNKKNIYIQWMGGIRKGGGPAFVGRDAIQPHELGIEKTLKILKAVVEQYPDAKTITAYRAGGARVTHGGGGQHVTRQIPRDRLEATPPVAPLSANKMPGLPSPGFGAMPGTRMTDLY